ncbi:hypothetical protein P8C59_009099 [Phyllachora maydis]|uniref:DUF1304 domain-containing protein n=1 Tax=Phyllachora maydis TaxID=1825666 RepID=A0AAD9IBY5_9PEZI|nr:hypothetical protein P8C59_009099 [Phyllachora maydis]
MPVLSLAATGLLAALHGYILVLEMFLWTTPRARRAFGMRADFAAQTRALAANQGLYNGFLAAGLAWGLAHPDAAVARQLRVFFAACVAVAGGYGGLTASRKILLVQGVPGVVALVVTVCDM